MWTLDCKCWIEMSIKNFSPIIIENKGEKRTVQQQIRKYSWILDIISICKNYVLFIIFDE